MSLLNQYLKTIGETETDRAMPTALPTMVKGRSPKKYTGRQLCKIALLVLIPSLAVGAITWRFARQVSSDQTNPKFALLNNEMKPASPQMSQSHRRLEEKQAQVISPPLDAVPVPVSVIERGDDEFANSLSNEKARAGQTRENKTSVLNQTTDIHSELLPVEDLTASLPEVHVTAVTDVPIAKINEAPIAQQATEKRPAFQKREPENIPTPRSVVKTKAKNGAKTGASGNDQNYYQLGIIALSEGNLVDAAHYFDNALKHKPKDVNALLNLSNVYIRQNRLDAAEKVLQKIQELDSRHTKSLDNLGVIALRRGERNRARELFLKALQLNAADEIALINLGYLAQIDEQTIDAVRYYDQILVLNPENSEALLNLAHLKERGGEMDRAVTLYNQALTILNVQNDPGLAQKIKNRINLIRRYN